MACTVTEFIHGLRFDTLPPEVVDRAGLCLRDLIGVGAGGAGTRLSALSRDHAAAQFGGPHPMLFDGRSSSAAGVALAGGMTIDALDGHDGSNPTKGHVGCHVFPGTLALAMEAGLDDGAEFLTAMVLGYELGTRLGTVLHATACDYHTSGAWGAVAVAAVGARLLGLSPEQTRHALGIAEYHGPRSQMMRVIDRPTMLKDGSGWGAMAGVSAALLARAGFTGAPALTVESAEAAPYFADLGGRWMILEQYFKPYPVCRWAQPPVEAVLELRRAHGLTAQEVAAIEVESFHEATRLATADVKTTEEAQYSTAFPCAVALVRGGLGAADVSGGALHDPEIRRLAHALSFTESEMANAAFPGRRFARVRLTLSDGRALESRWHEPRWDAAAPPTEAELRAKFHSLAAPALGTGRTAAIEAALGALPEAGLAPLIGQLTIPASSC